MATSLIITPTLIYTAVSTFYIPPTQCTAHREKHWLMSSSLVCAATGHFPTIAQGNKMQKIYPRFHFCGSTEYKVAE